ncbi:MAG: penicillin acylase family protein [Deltaproteobacteria bacterium]|uniref:Penicillin acylase family protein n=1 Tax=Candidatus Zymogenus saltonus TaxID=2844893 RepID=A0A9D8KF96_9DELT|nr:penicillin acylase family protein [Candidatus Zymogenus saltonus]
MKAIKWTLIVVVCLVVVAVVGGYIYLKSTLPDYGGELAVEGIGSEVKIIRDSYGMPHIFAETDEDAYFALGYTMAQDRMFQIDLVRRVVRGQLSEILGEELIPVDRLFRTITAKKSLEELYNGDLPPEIRSGMEAFTAGVNCYLENRGGPLPVEFAVLGYKPEPWKAEDCWAAYYYMAWDLNTAFGTEMLYDAVRGKVGDELAKEIMAAYPEGSPTIMPGGKTASLPSSLKLFETLDLAMEVTGKKIGSGSNNWLVSGKKSVTGKPILANDMHLGFGAPGIWYEAHIKTPTMNVTGVITPGIPLVAVGATETVAWGYTNVMSDDADFYIEKINPDNEDQYEYMGKWEDMEVREEVIKVKGKDDVKFKVRLTRHGPIVDDVNGVDGKSGYAYAMRWIAPELPTIPMALYAFNRAKTIDDMEKGIEYFKCPGQNVIYADSEGNVGYTASVGIPIRNGFDGMSPLPGWDGKYEWGGFVPTNMQPRMRNPERGWIASANNKHVGEDYPYTISNYYAPAFRFRRISEMLTEKEKLDISDFKRMHSDVTSVFAKEWLPNMIEVLEGAELSDVEADALNRLKEWDCVADKDSEAAAIYFVTVNGMTDRTFKNRVGEDFYGKMLKYSYIMHNAMTNMISKRKSTGRESVWFDDPETEGVETFEDVVQASFKDAVSYFDREFGGDIDRWKWGKLHTLTLNHPFGGESAFLGAFLNIGPFPYNGSLYTVSMASYPVARSFKTDLGPSERYIFDLSDMKNSLRCIPGGISGNFMSPHYDDQMEMFVDVQYRPLVLDRETAEADARYVLTLTPACK